MQINPMEEWQRLTTLYGEMGDIEIRELAAQISDLTETAQRVLRDEMKKRGIVDKPRSQSGPSSSNPAAAIHWEPASYQYAFSKLADEADSPHEYTWKVPLCECETQEQASQLAEALRQAGVDSWIDAPRVRWGLDGPRILVAADQLDHAKAVASQPIPQDIIDESQKGEPQYFEVPVCPRCGATDPVLSSEDLEGRDANPDESGWVNHWLCDSCGKEWTTPAD
jgi:hypothetical protein